eukprot:350291-Amphidinium_carterae.1
MCSACAGLDVNCKVSTTRQGSNPAGRITLMSSEFGQSGNLYMDSFIFWPVDAKQKRSQSFEPDDHLALNWSSRLTDNFFQMVLTLAARNETCPAKDLQNI